MKGKKKLNHSSLVRDTTEAVSKHFVPPGRMVKETIEYLIEQEYMKRDEEEENVFAAFPGLLNEIVTNVTSVLGRQKEEVTFEVVASSNEHLDSEDDENDESMLAYSDLSLRVSSGRMQTNVRRRSLPLRSLF